MKPKRPIRILLIEDEAFDVNRIRKTIEPFRHIIEIREVVANGHSAVELLENNPNKFDVIIMDYQIAGGFMGEKLIRRMKKTIPSIQIIVVTKMTINITDYQFAEKLLEAGATWYCTKYPVDIDHYIYQPTDFILSIFNAYEKKRLEEERLRSNKKLQKNIEDILSKNPVIGHSSIIHTLEKQIKKCAETETNILIQGPSGTGKELVATHIHYRSKRCMENFIPINCGSLPDNLIESELFGFEKGSFTGASSKKKGLFEIADRGTIFLDEITELPLPIQSTLLRVIQQGEIDKIGRTEKVKVNVRIVAATNKNLEQEVKEKRFREDLYYRLNVVSIVILPLAQRKEDIPILIHHYMNKYCRKMNCSLPQISDKGMDLLSQYQWPGNVRELQNIVQRLLFLDNRKLDKSHVEAVLGYTKKQNMSQTVLNMPGWNEDHILPWREMEKQIQKDYFQFVRLQTSSDAEAARRLGLAPPNYHRICKELGLK